MVEALLLFLIIGCIVLPYYAYRFHSQCQNQKDAWAARVRVAELELVLSKHAPNNSACKFLVRLADTLSDEGKIRELYEQSIRFAHNRQKAQIDNAEELFSLKRRVERRFGADYADEIVEAVENAAEACLFLSPKGVQYRRMKRADERRAVRHWQEKEERYLLSPVGLYSNMEKIPAQC